MTSGNKLPIAGILIPTFNRKKLLKYALTSVIGQSTASIEIIVIDNGSTDGTAEFVQKISDCRLRYIVNDHNIGIIGSINKGISLFSESVAWCTVLCDDDLIDENYVTSMLQFVRENKVASIVHGRRRLIDDEGRTLREASPAPFVESSLAYIESRAKRRRETFLTGVFFSRMFFSAIGGYPHFTTGLASDDAFIFALALKDALYYNPDAVSCVRIHGGAESHDVTRADAHFRALREYRAYAADMAQASGKFQAEECARLERLLKNFARNHDNELVSRALAESVSNSACVSVLVKLHELAGDAEYPLSLRVRIELCLAATFNLNLHRSKFYRVFWGRLAKFRYDVKGRHDENSSLA